MIVFGSQLRNLRKEAGFMQEELARRSDVSHITISRLEQDGEGCKIETARKLARGLKVPLPWLFVTRENRAELLVLLAQSIAAEEESQPQEGAA